MFLSAEQQFREYNIPGNPLSLQFKPLKSDLREWGRRLERGLRFVNRADAIASHVPSVVATIFLNGNTTEGIGAATYVRMGAAPSPSKAWHLQTADGAWWELLWTGTVDIDQLGAGLSNATNDTAAVQAARDFVYAKSTATEGAKGEITSSPSRIYLINGQTDFTAPIRIHFPSIFLEQRGNGASPITFVFGSIATAAGLNTQYSVYVQTLVASNQNTATPSAVDNTGGTGVVWRNVQFSRFEFGSVRQFSKAGYHFDCDGGEIGSPDKQHVQQCKFYLGQIGYCGYGILARSKSATDAAFQANVIEWQDMIANVTHIDAAEASGGDLPADTSVNIWRGIVEKQAQHPAGVGISLQASYNSFEFPFCEASIVLQASCVQNKIKALNTPATGITFTDNSSNDTNYVEFGEPAIGTLPASIAAPADNTYQTNTVGVQIEVVVDTTLNCAAGSSATAELFVRGPSGTEHGRGSITLSGVALTQVHKLKAIVPAYWQWKIRRTVTGGSTVVYNGGSIARA